MSDFRDWIKLRNETKNEDGKLCYCGHTDRCDCGDPSSEMFENALEGDLIILGDPKNGWKNILEPKHGGDEEIKSFYSKYDKKTDCIVSVITMNDDSTQEMSHETGWYASRKDKKW